MDKLALPVAVIALILSAVMFFGHAPASEGLGATNGDTTSFQNLVLQTYSGATSTAQVGCVQTLATSSATSIKLIYNTVATTTGNGFVLWSYGTCP